MDKIYILKFDDRDLYSPYVETLTVHRSLESAQAAAEKYAEKTLTWEKDVGTEGVSGWWAPSIDLYIEEWDLLD